MRTLTIDVFAKVGVWCCQKAIRLADTGHIDFEVAVPQKQPLIIYQTKTPRKSNYSFLLILMSCILTGVSVWGVLTLAFSVENSCEKVTQELKREHEEEKQRFIFLNAKML